MKNQLKQSQSDLFETMQKLSDNQMKELRRRLRNWRHALGSLWLIPVVDKHMGGR